MISEESLEDSERFQGAGAQAADDVAGPQPKPVADAAPAKIIEQEV